MWSRVLKYSLTALAALRQRWTTLEVEIALLNGAVEAARAHGMPRRRTARRPPLPAGLTPLEGSCTVHSNPALGSVGLNGGPGSESKVGEADGDRRLNFGRLLSSALKARNMKQEELAGMLGTTQSSVSGWIHGKYEPVAATVFCVERCLGLDPGSLSRPLGYLPVEPRSSSVNVETAIAQSAQLDDEEKAALAAMYRVLVKRSLRQSRISGTPTTTARPRSIAGGR